MLLSGDQVRESGAWVSDRVVGHPGVALVLGSGLGPLADTIEDAVRIPYDAIPHFPRSTAPGHQGTLVIGSLEGHGVVAMAGRVHLYEGYSPSQVSFGVRVMRAMGARTLIVSNAAGGISESFHPGVLMIISDHINLTGLNPLVGPPDSSLGTRFPDMSEAYSTRLRRLAHEVAGEQGIEVVDGVYLGLLGPSYETPAEIRMARGLGADAVGMSTVMEVIAANHMGVEVLGVSCITNMAAGMLPQRLTEAEVLETAARVQNDFSAFIRGVVSRIEP